MVLLLAPKIIRMSWPKHWITTVRTRAVITSMEAQLPRMRSACWGSPLPIMMEARGAPPMLTRAAKAEIAMITGKVTPTPVSALAPSPGRWPIYIRSTILYRTLMIWAVMAGRAN